ncbi:Hypothetical predicted protein [Mytilus galloprovincialis]|uniref:Uncharacterized protein n=1 Tax=Mytilus galloprovincialis TaxID=29158 RepID=A0A8B6CDQ2_MYTGA|nr:Hypothetical predicted protein [Mytilus galloprovincialis]
MAKRPNPSTSSSEEIVGYLHDISPIKTSKNNTRYFNATLQNRDEFHRLVCFSLDKLSAFTNAEKMKSPLKLTNIAMVPSVSETGKIDIKVSRFSNLNIVDKLPFKRRKLDFDDNVSNLDELKISHQTVSVSAKVTGVYAEQETVDVYGTSKEKKEFVIADGTSAMPLVLWNEQIDCVQRNECYNFKNVSTRIFQDNIKLSATTRTVIKHIPPMENITTNLLHIKLPTTVIGNIHQVLLNKTYKCGSCSKNVMENDMGKMTTKCTSCSMKQRNESLKLMTICKLNVVDDSDSSLSTKLTIFDTELKSFLHTIHKEDLVNQTDDFEDFMLTLPKIRVTHANNIVTSICIQED